MERRGRIPVAKWKTRSRSRVRDPDYNEQDPDCDLFTLLEDNIALKEENKALKLEIEEHKKMQSDLLENNTKMEDELNLMSNQQSSCQQEIKELTTKFSKMSTERNALEKLNKSNVDKINSLSRELESLQRSQQNLSAVVVDSIDLKGKLLKVLPTLTTDEMESLADIESPLASTSELVERLVDEFLKLKNCMGAVELQLYEANEKISELMEHQNHLDEENETLRSENTNLTKVAKLLTENMKESVETSKKMETALIKLKQRNDELVAKSKDYIDGIDKSSPSPTTVKANEEFEQMKTEVETQNRDHNERIVEMKTLMDAAIQKNTNDELKTLQLRLEILEKELRKALERAECAESQLDVLQKRDICVAGTLKVTTPLRPPPPPPPLPPTNLIFNNSSTSLTWPGQQQQQDDGGTFCTSIANHNLHRGEKIIDNVKQQVQPEAATGLDALVREFKSGRVTLRRNRRKTRTNEALQEMFSVLEISQRQNRDSKICIDLHI